MDREDKIREFDADPTVFVDVDVAELIGKRWTVTLHEGRVLENAELLGVEWLSWQLEGAPVRHPVAFTFREATEETIDLVRIRSMRSVAA